MTSICSTLKRSTSISWSAPKPDTSRFTTPLVKTFTRSPVKPLMVGLLTAAPKSVTERPKNRSRASPRPSVAESVSASLPKTSTVPEVATSRLPSKDAVTMVSSILASSASSVSSVIA